MKIMPNWTNLHTAQKPGIYLVCEYTTKEQDISQKSDYNHLTSFLIYFNNSHLESGATKFVAKLYIFEVVKAVILLKKVSHFT